MKQRVHGLSQIELDELDLLQLEIPQSISTEDIDSRGWRRMAVVTGRCTGACSGCMCVRNLQELARHAIITEVFFGCSGSPVLTPQQLEILRAKREEAKLNEVLDMEDIVISIPPAPLAPCSDSEL